MTSTTDNPDLSKLDKIRALLDKAESTAFADEAESYTAKAIELMARYRIDEAMIADARPPEDRGKIVEITFSAGAGPYVNARVELANQIAMANSVRLLMTPAYKEKFVHLIGYETDVALVEMLYTSLLVQATSAMRSPEIRSAKADFDNTKTFLRSFLISFAGRIGNRLRESNNTAAEQTVNDGRSVALVLADRTADVDADVLRRYGKLRRARNSSAGFSSAGYSAGREAADRADLSTNRRVSTSNRGALSA